VASNHALATALYARRLDLDCTCLLSHQVESPAIARVLRLLLQSGAEIVRYGGDYRSRVETMRRYLQGRRTWAIPLGGSSWLGAVGYVSAGLELAAQVGAGEIDAPERIYLATGTMGSAGGLALGLALAGMQSEVQAVRVSPDEIMNRKRLDHLMAKTASMLNRLDPSIPVDLHRRARIEVRHEFFAGGYARSNVATDAAISIARDALGLDLESTYTGKAMAALLYDAGQAQQTRVRCRKSRSPPSILDCYLRSFCATSTDRRPFRPRLARAASALLRPRALRVVCGRLPRASRRAIRSQILFLFLRLLGHDLIHEFAYLGERRRIGVGFDRIADEARAREDLV
jgi:1-aminocyclopropane-1-carboxylate deaminase/D-cysteine desulfhydrase-like pyridoxal-dependent ACC family enzyme